MLQEYEILGPLSDDKLHLLREERLEILITSEADQLEKLLTDQRFEEVQVRLQLADLVFNELVTETA